MAILVPVVITIVVLGWYSDLGYTLREVGRQSLAQVDFKINTFEFRIEHSLFKVNIGNITLSPTSFKAAVL